MPQEPTAVAEGAARPPRRRTRGRVSPALWIAVVVLYPLASLLFRLR